MKSPSFLPSSSPTTDNFDRLSLGGSAASVRSGGGTSVRDLFGDMGGVVESHSNLGEISFVTPFNRGVSLVQMLNQSGVCCASVGSSGNKMCFRQIRENQCPASHRKNKIDLNLQGPTLFRVDAGSSSTTLFIEPKLLVTESVRSIVQSLMYNQYTEESWCEEVATCEGALILDQNVDEFRAEFRGELSTITTPHQRKRAKIRASDSDGLLNGLTDAQRVERLRLKHLGLQELVKNASVAYLGGSPLENAELAAHFEASQRREELLVNLLQATIARMESGFKSNEEDIEQLSSSTSILKLDLRSVKGRVGTKDLNLDFLSGSSIWKAVQDLTQLSMDTGLMKLKASNISVGDTSFVRALVDERLPLGMLLASYTRKIDELEGKLQHVLTGQGLSNTVGGIQSNFLQQPVSAPSEEITTLIDKVTALEKRVANSQAVGSDMSVQFRANIFNTQMDVSNYFRQFIGSPSVAPSLINDCFTLLHAISKGMMGESMELKDIYSVTRMGADISEADLMNAIAGNQTGVPPFFKGNNKSAVSGVYTGTSTGPKHRLKGVPTYAAWGHPGSNDGVRYRALLHLDRIVQTTRNDIQARIDNPTISSFLENMLERSQEFVRKLFSFITDTYTELMRSFNDEERTWDFVCQCIEQIFAHEFDVARSILRGHDVTSVEFSQRMMWTSLRTIVVQETFLAKGIDNHKCLAGAYYKFLMRNSQSSQVSVMKKTVDKMAASNEALIKKVAAAEAKVRGAEGAADKAAKAVKELERKFNKQK